MENLDQEKFKEEGKALVINPSQIFGIKSRQPRETVGQKPQQFPKQKPILETFSPRTQVANTAANLSATPVISQQVPLDTFQEFSTSQATVVEAKAPIQSENASANVIVSRIAMDLHETSVATIESEEDSPQIPQESSAKEAPVEAIQDYEKIEAPTRDELVKLAKRNMKELEKQLESEKSAMQDLQNIVAEYVSNTEERMDNMNALIAHQKEVLAAYLGEELAPKHVAEIPLKHQRPGTRFWNRKPREDFLD
ncbi:MAG: hypothetical protein LBI43_00970 [Streptococcaceae bacterium]|nr:hypothetical protein [Streptococcaceae bacterium]